MKINIRQKGGVAGTIDLGGVDTAAVGERGRRIEQLVAAVRSRPAAPKGVAGADLPLYEITIVEDGWEHRIEAADQGGERDAARDLAAAVGGLDADGALTRR